MILNGHEYVACQARKAGIRFIKNGNCFTAISNTSGFVKIAETLSEQRAIGRLRQVCERWIYRSCLCFALDFEEQQRSGFRYHFSNYQMEYSRNLIFVVGGRMEQVFQALIDRSRAPLDLTTIKTILGDKGRPKYRPRNMRAAEWEVAVERPTYDLTVFKLHCGKLTLKIYSKGERVLRIEAVAHNIREFHCGRLLDKFPEIVRRLRGMLERFMEALSCIDQCFIGDEMLERLPLPSRVGKSTVGGIDLNKPRLRHLTEAIVALSASPDGFTASALADQVRALGNQSLSADGPRQAAYDLKKLRGKDIVRRIGSTIAMNLSRPVCGRSPPCSSFATRPSNPSSPPLKRSPRTMGGKTPEPSIATTSICNAPCRASFMNSVSQPDDRQLFCRASPLSAYP